jgi:hypothetical protein
MVIYQIFVFGTDRKSNMAARAHNVFWLVEILKIFLLETTKPIELWQVSDTGSPEPLVVSCYIDVNSI